MADQLHHLHIEEIVLKKELEIFEQEHPQVLPKHSEVPEEDYHGETPMTYDSTDYTEAIMEPSDEKELEEGDDDELEDDDEADAEMRQILAEHRRTSSGM
eukprot:TRINITY_DN10089_c0_g1_i2.p3 TRINITY_DN10089_c0_g1~~TRINITY_DN10089_c0_g1_i2.p3  ORF type:complete len:100 (+),score=44.19 TRINITY_DN10089_c0_g1_i2:226-525(+)